MSQVRASLGCDSIDEGGSVARKQPEEHVYADLEVSRTRLDAFSAASRIEQARALATLRAQAADESAASKLGLLSVLVATLVVILAPIHAIDLDDRVRENPLAVGIIVAVVVVVLLLAFAPALIDMARDQNRRERARVWLGAFEDELARRHRLRGRAARRWQKEH
jgi:hypothetical protein